MNMIDIIWIAITTLCLSQQISQCHTYSNVPATTPAHTSVHQIPFSKIGPSIQRPSIHKAPLNHGAAPTQQVNILTTSVPTMKGPTGSSAGTAVVFSFIKFYKSNTNNKKVPSNTEFKDNRFKGNVSNTETISTMQAALLTGITPDSTSSVMASTIDNRELPVIEATTGTTPLYTMIDGTRYQKTQWTPIMDATTGRTPATAKDGTKDNETSMIDDTMTYRTPPMIDGTVNNTTPSMIDGTMNNSTPPMIDGTMTVPVIDNRTPPMIDGTTNNRTPSIIDGTIDNSTPPMIDGTMNNRTPPMIDGTTNGASNNKSSPQINGTATNKKTPMTDRKTDQTKSKINGIKDKNLSSGRATQVLSVDHEVRSPTTPPSPVGLIAESSMKYIIPTVGVALTVSALGAILFVYIRRRNHAYADLIVADGKHSSLPRPGPRGSIYRIPAQLPVRYDSPFASPNAPVTRALFPGDRGSGRANKKPFLPPFGRCTTRKGSESHTVTTPNRAYRSQDCQASAILVPVIPKWLAVRGVSVTVSGTEAAREANAEGADTTEIGGQPC